MSATRRAPVNLLEDEMPVKKRAPVNLLEDEMKESFATSLGMAPFRIGKDLGDIILEKLRNAPQTVPEYYEKAKTEIPGLFDAVINHPLSTLKQETAGLAELGKGAFNLPHDISEYATHRLNLVPEDINQKIQMGRMPEEKQKLINEFAGEPEYPGQAMLRGGIRNLENIIPAKELATLPLKLTSGNIAKSIIEAGEKNKKIYGGKYSDLWKEASQKGFDNALYNVNIDMKTIKKYSPQKGIKGIIDFDTNPTLQNAHAAKSDLLRIQRDLNKLPTLRSAERQQLKAVNDAIDSIQKNMFKDTKGNINKNMLDRYNQIQRGYAEEVVPYKNKSINKFKRNEISADELKSALSKGEFAAKRGSHHKALMIRKALEAHPYLYGALGLGGLGALGFGETLYKKLLGEK